MSEIRDKLTKDEKNKGYNKDKEKLSFKNLKKIRKDLMSFAEDEILDIKKSKKDINVASFADQELAPCKYSITTKKLNRFQSQNYDKKFEPVEEKVPKEKCNKNEEKKGENKNEISSSDISEDDE